MGHKRLALAKYLARQAWREVNGPSFYEVSPSRFVLTEPQQDLLSLFSLLKEVFLQPGKGSYEALVVTFHVFCTSVTLLPSLIIVFYDTYLRYTGDSPVPVRITGKWEVCAIPLLFACVITVALGLMELIAFYLTSAPVAYMRRAHAPEVIVFDTAPRTALKVLHASALVGFLTGYCCSIAMVLVWCILGAIINPVRFLAYAAGASTFITFAAAKAAAAATLFDKFQASARSAVLGQLRSGHRGAGDDDSESHQHEDEDSTDDSSDDDDGEKKKTKKKKKKKKKKKNNNNNNNNNNNKKKNFLDASPEAMAARIKQIAIKRIARCKPIRMRLASLGIVSSGGELTRLLDGGDGATQLLREKLIAAGLHEACTDVLLSAAGATADRAALVRAVGELAPLLGVRAELLQALVEIALLCAESGSAAAGSEGGAKAAAQARAAMMRHQNVIIAVNKFVREAFPAPAGGNGPAIPPELVETAFHVLRCAQNHDTSPLSQCKRVK